MEGVGIGRLWGGREIGTGRGVWGHWIGSYDDYGIGVREPHETDVLEPVLMYRKNASFFSLSVGFPVDF